MWLVLVTEFLGDLGGLSQKIGKEEAGFSSYWFGKNLDGRSVNQLSDFLGFIRSLSQFLTLKFLLYWNNLDTQIPAQRVRHRTDFQQAVEINSKQLLRYGGICL